MWELAMIIISGEEAQQTNALEQHFTDVKEPQMEIITSIPLWVENLLLYSLKVCYMVESKFGRNFQKEIGYGQLFGCFLDIMSMGNGQPVEKSILWRAEEMLDIQNNLEEDLNHLVQHYIGVQTSLQTNFKKLMLKNL